MISAHYARLLHRELSIRGHDEVRLFKGCSIDGEALWQLPKVDPEDFLRLLANAQEMLGQTPLGTVIVSRNGIATLGMMGVAMMSAPTLGAGLQAMSSYSTLEADYLHFELLAGQNITRITLEADRDLGASLLIHAETVFALLQDYLTDLLGGRNRVDGAQYSKKGLKKPSCGWRIPLKTRQNGGISLLSCLQYLFTF